ncbi:MAG: prephenate dehydrogenase/arogenate dehydrogenase family protein [Anaerolineales bacterium]|nr:prephenate dehydrogenase/arogenate dehydrogenase family protein [Anaerolineales bacterium]
MPVQITIIGLGQIGASFGLALAAHKDKVTTVGHDKEFSIERLAQKDGVVDKTNHNLPSSVEDANLVVLALPVHQVRETLGHIAQDLKKGTVVVDTIPVKAEVAKWAQEILPNGVHYIGLVPAISPDYLHETKTGLDSAKADLFSKSIFLLSAPHGTPGEAIQLVSGLVSLTGGNVMITDIIESDGLMASAHLLPQLVSASLLNATMGQPGWRETRKAASRAYFAATSAMTGQDDTEALQMLVLQNRENVLQKLDAMITALVELRYDVEDANEKSLKDRLKNAQDGRQNWLNERFTANWMEMKREPVEKISVRERLFGTMFSKPDNKDK